MPGTKTLSVLLAVCMVTAAVGPAVAQTEDDGGLFDGLTGDEDMTLSDRLDAANGAIAGWVDRLTYQARTLADDRDESQRADDYATDLAETYNSNNDTLETWVNARFSGNASDWNVVKVTLKQEDATATRYLVADVDNTTGNFTDSKMVNSTTRTTDAELTLEANAASNAADELQTFVHDYAAKDKTPGRTYLSRMAQQYAGNVELPDGVMPE